jgi:VanZ family protein
VKRQLDKGISSRQQRTLSDGVRSCRKLFPYNRNNRTIPQSHRKDAAVLRWLIWLGFVIPWSVALEIPFPETADLPGGEVLLTNRRLIAKSLHVAVYAFMAILSGWVPMAPRFRWVMMFFLMGHAWGSEYVQELLQSYCFRGGKLSDVGFDIIGIIIGVGLSWKWWAASGAERNRDQ